jgi:hypothetical protein
MSLVYNRLFLFFIFYGRFSFTVRREKYGLWQLRIADVYGANIIVPPFS